MAAQYSSAAENMMQVKDYYKQGGQVNMADAITELRRMSKEEGIEQGRAENARETARAMLERGYSDEEITDILKMDKAELDKIREEMMQMA
jgi:SOS response regulatory protein OraA/RecX